MAVNTTENYAGLTKQQVSWAKSHSWFGAEVLRLDGTWAVKVYDGQTDSTRTFTDFEELRAWAGY